MKVLLVSEIVYALIGFAGGLVSALAVFAVVLLVVVLPKKKRRKGSSDGESDRSKPIEE